MKSLMYIRGESCSDCRSSRKTTGAFSKSKGDRATVVPYLEEG